MPDEILVEYFEGTTSTWQRAKVPRGLIIEIDLDALEEKEEIKEKITNLSVLETWVGDAVMGVGSMLYVVPIESVEEVIALLNEELVSFNVYALRTCRFIRPLRR